ncbi:geranylgeranylglycerol-phosphate geranylgeranyltransferase [Hymenobacter fodinae]|uniref:Prenyltransferase n=1 Tax=Hymenobacter fodinae TaxID=2510796 RepID=A0A4Z0P6K4_9BACT|nr:geranylgeranylglycerol-phosphate geranylgeranyltransferase [Hymenobacter fodinae]TGE07545.1 prenyltransferase [Hymenobacter fodinae]
MAAPDLPRSNQPPMAEPGPLRRLALLVRLPNLLIMALCLLLVRKALLLPQASWAQVLAPSFALLALAALSIAAAGYIINDYYDVKIDAINRPDRLVVGKGVNRRHAMVAHLLLSGLGVLVSGALSPLLGLVNLGSALLLWGYSVRFKRVALVGNVSIAALTAALVLLPELQLRVGTKPVWLYALAAFLLTVVREILKDIEDMRGDAEHDCHTLPLVVGVPRTKWVAAFFLACLGVLIIGVEKVLVETEQWALAGWLFLLVLVPLGWMAVQLRRADRRRHFAQLSTGCKLVMLAGVLSMLLVG